MVTPPDCGTSRHSNCHRFLATAVYWRFCLASKLAAVAFCLGIAHRAHCERNSRSRPCAPRWNVPLSALGRQGAVLRLVLLSVGQKCAPSILFTLHRAISIEPSERDAPCIIKRSFTTRSARFGPYSLRNRPAMSRKRPVGVARPAAVAADRQDRARVNASCFPLAIAGAKTVRLARYGRSLRAVVSEITRSGRGPRSSGG